MEAKSKQRNLRVPKLNVEYVAQDGEVIRVMPGNTPRVSGTRTAGDKKFLAPNDGKLAKLM